MLCFLLVLLFVIVLGLNLSRRNSLIAPSPQALHGPVLIYAETIKATDNSSRRWPTLRISRIIGNSEPEVLVSAIGGVEEYPVNFILSPDKHHLLINLEKRLVMLDLNSKRFTPILNLEGNGNAYGVIYSPDGKSLFVWDQLSSGYSAYIFDLTSQNKTHLNNIKADSKIQNSNFVSKNWRSDNVILLGEPMGDWLNYWTLDLATLTLKKQASMFGQTNASGTVMGVPRYSINYPCPSYGGGEVGSYELVDPLTLQKIGRVGDDKKLIQLVDFSPDGSQVLYWTMDAIDPSKVKQPDLSNCDQLGAERSKSLAYFTQTLTGQPNQVSDYLDVLKAWKANNVGAIVSGDSNHGYYIDFNGRKIAFSASNMDLPEIVAQYYQ